MDTDFRTLYDFKNNSGIVIPQTSNVKAKIEEAFTSIFGSELSLATETPMGRLVEALTLLFVDILGVNAANANSMNPNQAVGAYLDAIGSIFGIARLTDESDSAFRNRLLQSQSRGSGFAQSIRQAISNVDGVTNICVLDNGHKNPATLPNSEIGIAVTGHTVFICVAGGSDNAIARAIFNTKSAGCGYTNLSEYGTPTVVTITDPDSGADNDVVFYRPTQKNLSIKVNVTGFSYTGDYIVDDTKRIIREYVNANGMCNTISKAQIITAIGTSGMGIVCTGMTMTTGDMEIEKVGIRPNEYVNLTDEDIEVTING